MGNDDYRILKQRLYKMKDVRIKTKTVYNYLCQHQSDY